MTPSELYARYAEFLTKAKADPIWLITCMQDDTHNLHGDGRLISLVHILAIHEKCMDFNSSDTTEKARPFLTQWLIDLHEAGEGVCLNDLDDLINFKYIIIDNWKQWLRFTITGVFYDPYETWIYLESAILDDSLLEPRKAS